MGRAPLLRARPEAVGRSRRRCTSRRSWPWTTPTRCARRSPARRCRCTSRAAATARLAFDATLNLRRRPYRRRALIGALAAHARPDLRPRARAEAQGRPAPPTPGGLVRRVVLALLKRIESGQLTVIEDGRRLVFGSGSPQATVVVHDAAVWRAALRGGRGLAETYVDGLWDSPDVTAVIEVAARNLHGIDRLRQRLRPCGRRSSGGPQHAGARAQGHRRALRPRQRPVRADARRDDDVLGRDLRAPRHDARRGVAGQARADLRQARPRAVRPRAGDRDRMGRVRDPRRGDPRLPRHVHHALARAARARPGAGPRRPASPTG